MQCPRCHHKWNYKGKNRMCCFCPDCNKRMLIRTSRIKNKPLGDS